MKAGHYCNLSSFSLPSESRRRAVGLVRRVECRRFHLYLSHHHLWEGGHVMQWCHLLVNVANLNT